MVRAERHSFLIASICIASSAVVGLSAASAAPADAAARGVSAEHARVVEYWTPARRAAAIPRDLVIDGNGQGYLRQADGSFAPYGRVAAEGAGTITPNAKPGGGSGDTMPPDITDMKPASGATIGASYTFQAAVTDQQSGLRSVKFYVQKGTGRAQSFSASTSGNGIWTVGLSGFSDGGWSWWVVATDTANNSRTSNKVTITVDTSSGGGGGGGGTDVVANDPWTAGGAVKSAAGRIYFEMPSNARRTRWAGYVCSGTVVDDGAGGRSIIVTAAHCVYDDSNKAFARNVMFIPDQDGTSGTGTDLNCSNDPYGCWTPLFGVVDSDWTTRTFPDNIPWDYAYYVVPDSGAHTAGQLTGVSDALDAAVTELSLVFALPAVNDGVAGKTSPDYTRALGYSYSDDPNFMYCAEDMTTEGTANWWLPSCGLSGGSSGGPWVQDMTSSGTGDIVSVNSWGYTDQPGMAGPKLSGTSASCMFETVAKVAPLTSAPATDGDEGIATNCN